MVAATSSLAIGLGVGLGLLALMVVWLIFARNARQRAAAAKRAAAARRGPFSSASPGFGGKAPQKPSLLRGLSNKFFASKAKGGLLSSGGGKLDGGGGLPLFSPGPAAAPGGYGSGSGIVGSSSSSSLNPMAQRGGSGANAAALAYAAAIAAEAEAAAEAAERAEAAAARYEDDGSDVEEEGAQPLPAMVWTMAAWDYDPQADDELAFKADAYLWTTGEDGCDGTEGWARGKVLDKGGFGGKEGIFPTMYVRLLTEEELLGAGLPRSGPPDRPPPPKPPVRKASMRVKGGMVKAEEEEEEAVDESAPLPEGWKVRGLKGGKGSGRWYEHTSGLVQHIKPKAKVVQIKKDLPGQIVEREEGEEEEEE